MSKNLIFISFVVSLTLVIGTPASAAKPLKVFILVGQSNMQGHAAVRTFEHLEMDPESRLLLQSMVDEEGNPKTVENVWITSIGNDGTDKEQHGQLIAGYGAAGREPKIGPELTFGIKMQEALDEPILLIKTAWGGKSLNTDFRSPSAGPYEFNENQLQDFEKRGKDVVAEKAAKQEAVGRYYRLMLAHVRHVLQDIERVYPDYDSDAGYELAGFVWFQGWNDMVDRGTYPERGNPGGYDRYSDALAHFIRDVRKELDAPKMPFVIGVMGAGGPVEKYGPSQRRYAAIHSGFRNAMSAPADLPEFRGNVMVVRTEECWDDQLGQLSQRWGQINAKRRQLQQDESLTPDERKQALDEFTAELYTPEELTILEVGKSNAEYHYLGSGKIMANIGKAFAEALSP